MTVTVITEAPAPLNTVFILLVFFGLFCFAISLMFTFYTCRTNQTTSNRCFIADSTADISPEKQYEAMVNMILCEGIWPVAFVFASLLTMIVFVLYRGPLPLTPPGFFPIKDLIIFFVATFLVWYGSLSFLTHHLGRPIRAMLIRLRKSDPAR